MERQLERAVSLLRSQLVLTSSSPRRLVESPRGATEMAPMEMAPQQQTAEVPAVLARETSQRACGQRPPQQAATRLRQVTAYARRIHRHHRAATSLMLSQQPVLSHQPQVARDPATVVAACVLTQLTMWLTMDLALASNPIGLAVQTGRAVHISPMVRVERALPIDQPFPIAQWDRAEPTKAAADSGSSRRSVGKVLPSAPE